ncbi:rhodanese-like domain-containing protein [Zavarzinia compransoris]|uniref:Thiosulfate sulfurtransferase n=1 Tax=Zavarzinia compransoris TaxID=1264899 RepID=A0A317DY93_9PROT|nr:rhodanese-like domain-containing protein [Zavarzinia compransoris]PWR17815.1 thiosulfate sulfurtransferase [Zavarzinia compransoris]TDP49348.1 rhodanese-related sulfurtransferase [Zavarzinia compransoris]
MTTKIPAITPATLRQWLHDGGELAILDAREEESFSASHLLHAANLPLSRLEVLAPALLPRPAVRLVLTDAGEGVAQRAAVRLADFGYTGVHVLEGGNGAWAAAGHPLYAGVHVPSKAFAEVVEHEWGTPWITARELADRRARGEKIALLDARPFEEHHNHTVPGSIFAPGAELPFRIADLVRDPDELVVVHCGGRTRSIIGAQALISAGLPNPVVSLKDGTMAWAMAGLDLAIGAEGRPPATVSPKARAFAEVAGARVAAEAGVRTVARSELEAWQAAGERTLYLFDVRTPAEYGEGHMPGSLSAPGGQLVQETDSFAAVLGARIVLVDDAGLGRARITAFWLKQLGFADVFVLDGGLGQGALETGPGTPRVLGLAGIEDEDIERVSPQRLLALLGDRGVEVIDLALSKAHKAGHVPGARFGIRARLADHLPEGAEALVLTSEDGTWARLAAADLRAAGVAGVPGRPRLLLLGGGNRAWAAAGQPLEKGIPHPLDTVDDVWFTPRERPGDTTSHMIDYLDWEVKLLSQLNRDPDNRFRLLRQPVAV